MIQQFLISMIATLSFAILFHAPKKEYIFCALTGAIGWVSYLIFIQYDISNSVASLLATFIMTILARLLSVVRRCPVTVFLVTGIFTLVPGAGIYYTAYYLIMNDINGAIFKGIETFKIAGSIVLGIVFGSALPQIWFTKIGNYFYTKYVKTRKQHVIKKEETKREE